MTGWVPAPQLGPRVYTAPAPADLAAKTADAAALRHLWAGPAAARSRVRRSALEGAPESCGTFSDYASGCMSFPLPGGNGSLTLVWGGNATGAPAFTTSSAWPLSWHTVTSPPRLAPTSGRRPCRPAVDRLW